MSGAALALAHEIAGCAPAAVRATKRALDRSEAASLEDQLSFEASEQAICFEGEVVQEGVAAVSREARAPVPGALACTEPSHGTVTAATMRSEYSSESLRKPPKASESLKKSGKISKQIVTVRASSFQASGRLGVSTVGFRATWGNS